ncbi:late embryogenesis abundant protein M17-like isoform X1 [Momordica charantia]|uniref:Late embryogenesis abundant protein M17-like isoform X1 n=1 Tax=Momordica charantia TaxID=3673 RepID=A0A6J1CHC2_MOMCH|nr:late embryogenesis abundant protein M17-like isoform X1 [Momordica charantia]
MRSKAVAFVCLLFISTVVIASAVSEGTQEQNEVEVENENPVEESKQRCRYGCCRFDGRRCVRCCRGPAEEEATIQNQNENTVEESEVETNGFGKGGGKGGKGVGGKGGGKGGKGGK